MCRVVIARALGVGVDPGGFHYVVRHSLARVARPSWVSQARLVARALGRV